MNLPDKIRTTIKKYSMLNEKDSVLLGLSGGADSVCLLIMLHQLKEEYKIKLSAIYIDHGLRPDETIEEKNFCQNLCDSLNVPFISKNIDVKSYAKEHDLNKQEAARDLRYKILEETANEQNANKIALAHNADDQAETFLMRILRGSGAKGLSGIPLVRGKVIRPLIEIERREIEEFFDNTSQAYMTDSSNLKQDYFRNWLRISVLPEFKRKNPDLIQTISRICSILSEEDNHLELIVTKTLMKLIPKKTDKTIELFLVPLESMDKAILRRILRRAIGAVEELRGINYIHIEEIIELIKHGRSGDRLNLPKKIRVIKSYSTLIITSELPVKLNYYSLPVPGELLLKDAGIALLSSFADNTVKTNEKQNTALDADKVKLPLSVRAREKGDVFYPSGFGKKKKLQDFFVDEKIPRDERDSIPIVLSGDDIVWVAGYRTDERFKADKDTKKTILIELKIAK